jgi:hypothetical protein
MGPERRASTGIADSLVRVSVGFADLQRFRQSWNPPPHTFTQQRGSWIYSHGRAWNAPL